MQFLHLLFICVRENNKRNGLQLTQLVLYLQFGKMFRLRRGLLHASGIRYIKLHYVLKWYRSLTLHSLRTLLAPPQSKKSHCTFIGQTAALVCVIRVAIRFALPTKCKSSDQIKNEIDMACSMYGEKMYTRFWWGNMKERGYLEDLMLDKRIILK